MGGREERTRVIKGRKGCGGGGNYRIAGRET